MPSLDWHSGCLIRILKTVQHHLSSCQQHNRQICDRVLWWMWRGPRLRGFLQGDDREEASNGGCGEGPVCCGGTMRQLDCGPDWYFHPVRWWVLLQRHYDDAWRWHSQCCVVCFSCFPIGVGKCLDGGYKRKGEWLARTARPILSQLPKLLCFFSACSCWHHTLIERVFFFIFCFFLISCLWPPRVVVLYLLYQ